ncbi:DNA adenine methylase [Solitalea koreensis]|nr:DNA adenine methylase [Solitalea koreensis]
MKNYTNAPLPFMGQKRRFLKTLKDVLQDYPQDAIYVDLFGGSGLLSHTVKQYLPLSKVVYNDFDNYNERLQNIANTNKILADLRLILAGWPKDKQITGEAKEQVIQRIKQAEMAGFVDYITLSSSLLFSMNYVTNFADFKASTLYNVVRVSDYSSDGYLDGLERVSVDYLTLYNQYKNEPNVVFMVDPPYLSTEAGTYKSYWKLKDYLDVLQVLDSHPYVYFTSNKSNIIELCEWIELKTPNSNPFKGACKKSVNVTMNYNSTYTDIMYYKYSSTT